MIPYGWKQARLGDHVEIFSGDAPANVTFATDCGLPYVKVEDMNACAKYQSESREYVSGIRNPVPSRSVIFPKRGAAIMGNKLRISATTIAIDTNMMALSPAASLDSEFLYYSLMHTKLFKIADTSTIPQINNKHILPYLFLLPPVAEQRRIAEILSTWDRAIEATERLIASSKTQKKALMQQLLTGKKRLPGFTGEWRWLKFSEVFKRVRQKNDVGNTNVLTISAQHGLISQVEYFNKSVASEDVRGYTLLRKGDFAYNKSYSEGYPVGAFKPLERYDSGIVSSLYICFRLADADHCHGFFRHYFETGLFNREISAIAQEGARNHGLLNVSVVDFFDTSLHAPSHEEQIAIAGVIDDAERAELGLADQLTALRQAKSALMQQLLTGMRRVKPPSAQEEAA